MTVKNERESIFPIERFVSIFGQTFRVIIPNTRKNVRLLNNNVIMYADSLGNPLTQMWIKHRTRVDKRMLVAEWVSYMTQTPLMFDDFLDMIQELHHLNLRD